MRTKSVRVFSRGTKPINCRPTYMVFCDNGYRKRILHPGAGATLGHPFRNHNNIVRHPARVVIRDRSFVKSVELMVVAYGTLINPACVQDSNHAPIEPTVRKSNEPRQAVASYLSRKF
jgi:hypothetical protein